MTKKELFEALADVPDNHNLYVVIEKPEYWFGWKPRIVIPTYQLDHVYIERHENNTPAIVWLTTGNSIDDGAS